MKQIHPAVLAAAVAGVVAAAASVFMVEGVGGFFGGGLALLAAAIAFVDARYFIIPNELTAAALLLALINAALAGSPSVVAGLTAAGLRGLATMLLFLAVRWIYRRLRRRDGLGLGDVKLAFVAGAWLDWIMIPVAIEIAALAALLAYGGWRIVGRRSINSTSRLPFGLFFAPAIWLSWLLGALLFPA